MHPRTWVPFCDCRFLTVCFMDFWEATLPYQQFLPVYDFPAFSSWHKPLAYPKRSCVVPWMRSSFVTLWCLQAAKLQMPELKVRSVWNYKFVPLWKPFHLRWYVSPRCIHRFFRDIIYTNDCHCTPFVPKTYLRRCGFWTFHFGKAWFLHRGIVVENQRSLMLRWLQKHGNCPVTGEALCQLLKIFSHKNTSLECLFFPWIVYKNLLHLWNTSCSCLLPKIRIELDSGKMVMIQIDGFAIPSHM